jgi:hypothetical protein
MNRACQTKYLVQRGELRLTGASSMSFWVLYPALPFSELTDCQNCLPPHPERMYRDYAWTSFWTFFAHRQSYRRLGRGALLCTCHTLV